METKDGEVEIDVNSKLFSSFLLFATVRKKFFSKDGKEMERRCRVVDGRSVTFKRMEKIDLENSLHTNRYKYFPRINCRYEFDWD